MIVEGEVGGQANRTPSADGAQAGTEGVIKRKWTVPYLPLVLDLMGLQVQVGVVCPEPRSRSGTTPDEYN